MKLSQLFKNCAYDVKYKTVGNDVNYAFVEDGETLYIYFQGSSSVTDWLRNFMFRARPYKDMEVPYKVHRGFLAAWKEVEDLVIAKVTDKKVVGWDSRNVPIKAYKYKRIVVVGYSHGGALAALCHECAWFHRPDIRERVRGYGFEAPRFYSGWRVKAQLAERWANFRVIRTNNDIVTHCPPKLFGYCHVGKLIRVSADASVVKGLLPKCVKSHYPQVVYDAIVAWEESAREQPTN